LRRFSSMAGITKWSLVRETQKRMVDDIIKVGVGLFVPTPEIEDRNEVHAGNWTNKMQELCYVFTIST
jgi:hypothetical protein